MRQLEGKSMQHHDTLLCMLFLVVLALVFPQSAKADQFDNPMNWSAYATGQGKIHMKLLYADLKGLNYYVQSSSGKKGEVWLEDNTNQKVKLLSFYETDTDNESDEAAWRWCNLQSHYGTFIITNAYPSSTGDVMVRSTEAWFRLQKTAGEAGPCYIEVDWYYPIELAGRMGDFYIDLNMRHRSNITWQQFASGLVFTSIDSDKPKLMEPQLAPDAAHAGQIMVGYQMQKQLRYVNYQFSDKKLNREYISLDTIKTSEMAGFIYFDAYGGADGKFQYGNEVVEFSRDAVQPLADMKLKMNYVYSTDTNGNPKTYNDIYSDPVSIPLLHNPRDLKISNLDNGDTELKWTVAEPDYIDIMPQDIFEIQRATNREFTDAQSIGTVEYIQGVKEFTFKDVKENFINNCTDGKKYYYRVRRQAQAVWGWKGDAEDSIAKKLFLIQPLEANVKKTENWESMKEVLLTWTLQPQINSTTSDGETHYGVYDDRANMNVLIEMLGKNGNVLYTEQVVHPHSYLEKGQLNLTLERSCVDYRFRIEVTKNSSTLSFLDGQKSVVAQNQDELRYENFGIFKNFTASQGTSPEYVELEWVMDDGDVDYFIVMRRTATATNWETIKTDLMTTYYRDNTALPLEQYRYKVVAVAACEDNLHESVSTEVSGWRQHTAVVDGYVRYPDGTAASGVTVTLDPPVVVKASGQEYLDFSTPKETAEGGDNGSGNETTEAGHYVVQSNSDFLMPTKFTLQMVFDAKNYVGTLFDNGIYNIRSFANTFANSLQFGEKTIALNHNLSKITICFDTETNNYYGTFVDFNDNCVEITFEKFHGTYNKNSSENFASKILLGVSKSITEGSADLFAKESSFGGMIDEVRIWNRLLTEKELENERPLTKLNGGEDGLILYWNFENDNADIVNKAVNSQQGLGATTYLLKDYDNNTYSIYGNNEGNATKASIVSNKRPLTYYQQMALNAVTDEKGHYVIDGIPYTEETTFTVAPVNKGEGGKFEPASQTVTFTTDKNVIKNVDFTYISTYKMTATVLYQGSSIPVQNAKVKLNGKLLYNALGDLVETDNQGEVTFRLPKGNNTIQIVKDGHTFLDEGYYIEDGDNEIEVDKDLTNIYFWDTTKVKVIGRVCGGNDQGDMKLGQDLSHNNLGDSLTIEMALEGDNTSWIVRDQLDNSVKERRERVMHHDGKHYTDFYANRHRIEIKPDNNSGEFVAYLYPVKYKVIEVSAKGYSTLFQNGQVGYVVDLTDSVKNHKVDDVEYNAMLKHVYHSPVKLTCEQFVPGKIPFFGEKQYRATNNYGEEVVVPIVDFVTDPVTNVTKANYVFGHPVFDQNRTYVMSVSVHEDYYYNNVEDSVPDRVMMKTGKVKVDNGLVSGTAQEEYDLEDGVCHMNLKATDVSYMLTGEDALKTISMSVKIDSAYVLADTIRAYVMGARAKDHGRELVANGNTYLFDILRDPPGSSSSAYIEEGTTFSYTQSRDFTMKLGFNLSLSKSSGKNAVIGTILGPMFQGETYSVSDDFSVGTDIAWTYHFDKAYRYSFTTQKKISTSSNVGYVGTPGDVYIGFTEAMVIKDAIAVRCVDDVMLEQVKGSLGDGTVKVIASGTASDGKKYHVIRDEVLSLGTKVKSTFAYSNKYIETTLIPDIMSVRNSLLFTGTKEDAKKKANYTKRPVYWTKRDPEDADFGVDNVLDGEIVNYNTTNEDLSYMIILPDGFDKVEVDTINALNIELATWVGFLGQNEKEKMEAYNLIGTHSVSGGTSFDYSEEYSGSLDQSRYLKWPFANGASVDFSDVAANLNNSIHESAVNFEDANTLSGFSLNFCGSKIELKFKPIIDVQNDFNYGKSESATKSIGCNITPDDKGSLTFDILRTNTINYDKLKEMAEKGQADFVLSNIEEFYKETHDNGMMDYASNLDITKYGSIVYRTVAGATRCPYEDERKTKYYCPGYTYDAKTKKIENPKIIVDKQEVSNVPADQPARFNIKLYNESEVQQAAPFHFDLLQDDNTNSKGAKLFVDGVPLADGRTITIEAGEVIEKTLEVYCGDGYDFEDIGLVLISQCEEQLFDQVNLSVHFIPSAGTIHVSTPTDKWVMNTESAYDNGYYLPVLIDGYNVNHRGFDHIELQYKLSTQSDRDWVNICSYYSDKELMEKASGTCELISDDGYLEGRLYGEKDPVEQYYDLRAVVYCRNGNDFITASSPVLSGIKDTRRPTVFGSPQPADGVLNVDEDIVVRFSENIATNYLRSVNNFEVTGLTNKSEITQTTSLRFSGDGYLMTDAKRNFATKDVTIEMLLSPSFNGNDMPLFSHGIDDNKLEFWLMGDGKLKATINNMEYISKSDVQFGGFRQVAMTFNQKNHVLKFYAGGTEIGSFDGVPIYQGATKLVFGTDHENKNFYNGDMLEARLWYRELSGQELTNYGFKRLTGYESGLVDYYMLNEGDGIYAEDKAQGATAELHNLGWTLPKGMALHIDFEDNGVKLNDRLFQRNEYQDYSLMFWFKTDQTGRGALISNGEGKLTDADYKNKFFIGFESRDLIYRSGGMEIKVPGTYDDNNWHHYAMTINRARNVGNIYMDHVLRVSFGLDSLGGISGDRLYLGSKHYVLKDKPGTEYQMNNLKGEIDDIVMFEQVMPDNVIKNYYNVSPSGSEMGLMVHAPFSKYKRQMNNSIQAEPSLLSTKVYKDMDGNVLPNKVDTVLANVTHPVSGQIITTAQEVLDNHVISTDFAPLKDSSERENLNFSFTAKDNELIFNLNEPDSKIEKTNVYVTLKEIPDLNGNYMASPTTFSFFVDRNQLKWKDKKVTRSINYGSADSFDILIENSGGSTHNYEIEGVPSWMQVTPYMGTINALEEQTIHIDVSKDLNVGSYDVLLFLENDNGVCERLPLIINVEGEKPTWTVTNSRTYTMNIVARVMVNDEIVTDTADIVGVFDKYGDCKGTANISMDVRTGESFAFITAYDDEAKSQQLYFKLWDASTGITYIASTSFASEPTKAVTVKFQPNTIVGTVNEPLLLKTGTTFVQKLSLKDGWNWVSLNVYNTSFRDITNVLYGFDWQKGDQLKDPMAGAVLDYQEKGWTRTDKSDRLALYNDRMYAVKVGHNVDVEISGGLLTSIAQRTIKLVEKWNYIGYTPNVNLPIKTALSGYFDNANDGDMVKSQDEFAVFHKIGDTDGEWKGNLKYMKTGEGYMFYRNASTEAEFTYPFVKPGTSFFDGSTDVVQAPKHHNSYGSSMTLVALPVGVEIEPGDRLVAYGDAEIRGVAEADEDGNFYISIGGDKNVPLSFSIEREGLVVAVTPEVMSYNANGISGKPDDPTCIDFVKNELADGYWYNLQGVRLNGKPVQSGVYIFNGKKVVVR